MCFTYARNKIYKYTFLKKKNFKRIPKIVDGKKNLPFPSPSSSNPPSIQFHQHLYPTCPHDIPSLNNHAILQPSSSTLSPPFSSISRNSRPVHSEYERVLFTRNSTTRNSSDPEINRGRKP